ncbi:MAG TPA: proton-conducting transporter membrane subunit [Candidatus Dormibacteraeota bacterium]
MNLSFLQDFGPVGILVLGACVCAALDLRGFDGRGRAPQLTRWVTLATLLLAFVACVGFWRSSFGSAPPDIEHGSLVIDRFALYFYAITLAAAGAVVLCGSDSERQLDPHRGVFHLLLLMSCAGVLFTASAADLVSLGSGLALAVLPLALAQGLHKTELGSVRTAARAMSVTGFGLILFLAGAAILAGLAGTTSLHAIPSGLRQLDPLLVLAAILLLSGAGIMAGLAPFLWWRSSLVARVPSLPFLAGILLGSLAAAAALLRLLPGALGAVPGSWTMSAAVVAGSTLVLAPLLAWRQRSLAPAVVYLLIAQLALVPATMPGISQRATAAILYSLLCVVPLGAGLLGLLGSITAQGEGTGTSDLRGIWARSPVLTAGLALLLVGLAGLPPTASFFVRLLTVDAALHSGLGWLAWLELVSAVLSALVVFRWLLTIFDARVDGADLDLPQRPALLGIVLCTSAVISFGLLLGPLFAIASRGALPPLIGP